MKKFHALDEYTDDDLIIIVYAEKDDWQKDAIVYAKKLLTERGVSEDYSKERIKELKTESEALWQKELEDRKTERYSIIRLVFMALFWPREVFWNRYLKREGYYRKSKQRLIAIGVGLVCSSILVLYSNVTADERHQERIDEINKMAELDSIATSQIDWSGSYVFIDSSYQSSNKIVWNLELKKEHQSHLGTLTFNDGSKKQVISCIGLLKDELIEFYPDTTYLLDGGDEISYYDRLFTLGRDRKEIYTKWGKLNPFISETRAINQYFGKNPASESL